MKQKISRLILAVVLVYAGLVGVMYATQRSMLYHPDPVLPAPSATKIPEMKVETVTTADGLTNLYWVHLPPAAPLTVVMFHGNAQNIAARDIKARPLIDAGFGVVLVEYRGFGGNAGSPTEAGLMNDSRAVIEALSQKHGVKKSKMIFYGESLGSGVATRMAHENPGVAGLILEVPFDSTLAVARESYPFILGLSYLMLDQYRSDTIIGNLKMPKLVMVAGKDTVVPPNHARRLFDLAAEPKKKIEFPDGGHSNLYDLGADKVVLKFLKDVLKSGHAGAQTRRSTKADDVALTSPEDLANIEPAAAAPSMFPPTDNAGETAPTATAIPLRTEPIEILSAGKTRARLNVELALRPDDQARGLQNRKSLDDGTGMLFIFPQNMIANFWMKDTLIPLDMIFIDQDGRIIKIHENAEPMDETIISSNFQSRAVLELKAGDVQKYRLSVGDLVLSKTLDQIVATTVATNN